jgi:hypothetical protein
VELTNYLYNLLKKAMAARFGVGGKSSNNRRISNANCFMVRKSKNVIVAPNLQ